METAKLQSKCHHQQTNTQFFFYKLDAIPVTQPTVSKHWRERTQGFHAAEYFGTICGDLLHYQVWGVSISDDYSKPVSIVMQDTSIRRADVKTATPFLFTSQMTIRDKAQWVILVGWHPEKHHAVKIVPKPLRTTMSIRKNGHTTAYNTMWENWPADVKRNPTKLQQRICIRSTVTDLMSSREKDPVRFRTWNTVTMTRTHQNIH